MLFVMDFSGHFDIWNNLEKNFFFHFFKIHRGDPSDYDQNYKGPPYEFWKNEKKNFFYIVPDIKMDQKILHKYHVQSLLAHREVSKISLHNKAFLLSFKCPIVQPNLRHFPKDWQHLKLIFRNHLMVHFVIRNNFLKRRW